MKKPVRAAEEAGEKVIRDYGGGDQPVASYLGLMMIYSLGFGSLYYLATRKGKSVRVPEKWDILLLLLGSYKFDRIVTMDWVTSPLRAPFTTRGESLKAGEVQDQSRGTGFQKAIGNLLTCPFCFGVWSVTGFLFAYNFIPRLTRQVCYVLSFAFAQDYLNIIYRNVRERSA